MDVNAKISKALVLAITYVNKSIKAVDEKDEKSLANGVWHVAAELEYALFLLSLAIEREINKSGRARKIQNEELASILNITKDLLKKAESQISNDKLIDAYKSTFLARKSILILQKYLERKNRKLLKDKKNHSRVHLDFNRMKF